VLKKLLKKNLKKIESKLTSISKKFEAELNPLGKHEGGWEHITVRVDANLSQIIGVYYGQYSSGQKILSSFLASTLKKENEHPVVFSARNGHASYFSEGDHPSETKKEVIDIEYAKINLKFEIMNGCEKVTKFDSSDKLEIINAADISTNTPLFPLKTPSWLNYQGQWGMSEILEASKNLKSDPFKSVEQIYENIPKAIKETLEKTPIVKEVKSKLENMIPAQLKTLFSPSGPKCSTSFSKNEFA